jgi:hypothetical protein
MMELTRIAKLVSNRSRAIAVATLYHAIGYLTVTVAGLYFYLQMRISFREIGRAKEELAKEES